MAILNKYKNNIPTNAVYIGRGGKWGNPFVIDKHGTRDEVCDKHADWLRNQVKTGRITLEDLAELHGKDLVCFCAPKRCHGEILVKAADWAFTELLKREQNSESI